MGTCVAGRTDPPGRSLINTTARAIATTAAAAISGATHASRGRSGAISIEPSRTLAIRRSAELEAPADQAAYRSRAPAERRGNLGLRQIVEMAQDDSCALSLVRRAEQLPARPANRDRLTRVRAVAAVRQLPYDDIARRQRPTLADEPVQQRPSYVGELFAAGGDAIPPRVQRRQSVLDESFSGVATSWRPAPRSDGGRGPFAQAHRQGRVPAQDAGVAPARARQRAQVRVPVEECLEPDLALHPGQCRTQAEVPAG